MLDDRVTALERAVEAYTQGALEDAQGTGQPPWGDARGAERTAVAEALVAIERVLATAPLSSVANSPLRRLLKVLETAGAHMTSLATERGEDGRAREATTADGESLCVAFVRLVQRLGQHENEKAKDWSVLLLSRTLHVHVSSKSDESGGGAAHDAVIGGVPGMREPTRLERARMAAATGDDVFDWHRRVHIQLLSQRVERFVRGEEMHADGRATTMDELCTDVALAMHEACLDGARNVAADKVRAMVVAIASTAAERAVPLGEHLVQVLAQPPHMPDLVLALPRAVREHVWTVHPSLLRAATQLAGARVAAGDAPSDVVAAYFGDALAEFPPAARIVLSQRDIEPALAAAVRRGLSSS